MREGLFSPSDSFEAGEKQGFDETGDTARLRSCSSQKKDKGL